MFHVRALVGLAVAACLGVCHAYDKPLDRIDPRLWPYLHY